MSRSPNDTRYPPLAILTGFLIAAVIAAVIFLLPSAWVPFREIVTPATAAFAGLLVAMSLKVADQWEKAVVLRMGKYLGLRGPGVFFILPVVDRVSYHVDQRIRTDAFDAEECLTKDTVPVNVDAIAFWIVNDVERAALRVQQYQQAVILTAQTALRDAIGKHDLAELIQSRKELGDSLKEILDEKMHHWGIQMQSVEIVLVR